MENFVFSTLSEDEITSMINAMEPFRIDAGMSTKFPFCVDVCLERNLTLHLRFPDRCQCYHARSRRRLLLCCGERSLNDHRERNSCGHSRRWLQFW